MGIAPTQLIKPECPLNKERGAGKANLCTQCGAPLHGSKCEYCETEYGGNRLDDGGMQISFQSNRMPDTGEIERIRGTLEKRGQLIWKPV